MRRRCDWCAVPLRWWQIRFCRMCSRALLVRNDPDPPCWSTSRYHAAPDRFFSRVDSRPPTGSWP